MSDLEELERARGNNEFVDTAASGSLGSLQNCGARTASIEMCTFLVMNILSLQLIPVNIKYYRLSQPVWECQSSGGHSARDRGDVF